MESPNQSCWYLKCKFCQFAFLRIFLVLVFSFSICQIITFAQKPKSINVGNITAEVGKKVSGFLEVPEGIDQGTIIPITIINGLRAGPVLTLVAGMHGTEYVPIITLQRMLKEIDPNELAGSIIMVHIANITSFKGRSIYRNPVDGKNLNRVFPGNKDGTLTERIANVITNEIIDQSNYLLDLHGGELNENMENICSFENKYPDNSICEKTKLLASSFGGYIEPDPLYNVPDTAKCTFCHLTAIRRGIPAIWVEAGGRGDTDNSNILYMMNGIKNVLTKLRMIKGDVLYTSPVVYLVNENLITSNVEGLFYSNIKCGQTIKKGSLLGYVTDYLGNRISDFYSPISGLVTMSFDTPVVNIGEDVFCICETSETF